MVSKEIFDSITVVSTDMGHAVLIDDFNKYVNEKNLLISKLQKSLERKTRIIKDLLEDLDE